MQQVLITARKKTVFEPVFEERRVRRMSVALDAKMQSGAQRPDDVHSPEPFPWLRPDHPLPARSAPELAPQVFADAAFVKVNAFASRNALYAGLEPLSGFVARLRISALFFFLLFPACGAWRGRPVLYGPPQLFPVCLPLARPAWALRRNTRSPAFPSAGSMCHGGCRTPRPVPRRCALSAWVMIWIC